MNTIFTNTQVSVEEIVNRIEWLRESVGDMQADPNTIPADLEDESKELADLEALMKEMAGYGGDEQWEGEWYPQTLIHDSYFEEAMRELCEDIGAVPTDFPDYIAIDWEVTAKNLQVDYSSVEYQGDTYWYR